MNSNEEKPREWWIRQYYLQKAWIESYTLTDPHGAGLKTAKSLFERAVIRLVHQGAK